MKENFERLYKSMKAGLDTAHSYICDDMEAICDDTFEGYSKSTLDELDKSIEAARDMHGLIQKKMPLFLDALTDISVNVGWDQLTFEDSRWRNTLIQQWAEEFVAIHDNTDWEQTDYILTVDEFATKKLEEYKKQNPSEKKFRISYVLGTEAVREYERCVEEGRKWNISSLCDCGSACRPAVAHGEFSTQAELDAYKQGIEDANGWLEAERIMTDEEWAQYLEENKDFFEEDEE